MGVMANWRLARAKADLGRAEGMGNRDAVEQWEEAERLGRKATEVFAGLLGAGDPLTLRGRSLVGRALAARRRWEDAEHELRLGLASADEGTAVVGQLRAQLAHVLRVTGRLSEAEAEARAAMVGPEGNWGSAGAELALVLGDLGKHGEAAELLAGIAAARAEQGGAWPFLAIKSRSDRLSHLAYLGQHEEAAVEAAAVRAAARQAPEPVGSLTYLAASNGLAVSLCLQGLHQEAESLLQSALAEAERHGYDRFELVLYINLARATAGQGKAGEAWEAASAAGSVAERMNAVATHDRNALSFARATALLAADRPADAEREARTCLDLSARHLAPVHHRALEAETLLGVALVRQGKYEEAEEQLQAALGAWLDNFGEQHHGTAATRRALAEAAGRA